MRKDEENPFKSFGGDDDEEPQSFSPDPLAAQRAADARRADMTRIAKEQHGLEDDEIKTLFPNDVDLEAFLADAKKAAHSKSEEHLDEDEDDKVQEDDAELSDSDKHELNILQESKRRRKILRNILKERGKAAAEEEFQRQQETLPADKRVSYSEWLASIDGLDDLTYLPDVDDEDDGDDDDDGEDEDGDTEE